MKESERKGGRMSSSQGEGRGNATGGIDSGLTEKNP